MNPTLVKIAEMAHAGTPPAEIAARLGVSDAWVDAVMGTDAFKTVLAHVGNQS